MFCLTTTQLNHSDYLQSFFQNVGFDKKIGAFDQDKGDPNDIEFELLPHPDGEYGFIGKNSPMRFFALKRNFFY